MLSRVVQKACFVGAAVMLSSGFLIVGGNPAGASFPGTNGDLVWNAICITATGQQIWSANNQAHNLVCPSGSTTVSPATASSTTYTPVTAGPTDSMAYFSSDGATVFFSSTRPNASSNTHNAIWWVPYANTVTGSAAPFSDNATELTTPGTAFDYAPTVSTLSGGGLETLAWIRCTTGATASHGASGCSLWTEQLTNNAISSTAAQVTTVTGTVAGPFGSAGDTSRPEIDPANANEILYTDTTPQIHIVSINGTPLFGGSLTDVNLSAGSTCPACTAANSGTEGAANYGDSSPDWSPDGTAIVFDSARAANYSGTTNNQNGGSIPYTFTNISAAPTATPVWNGIPASLSGDSFVEPVYAPNSGTGLGQAPDYNVNPNKDINPSAPNGTPPTLAWIQEAASTNVGTLDDGNVGNNNMVAATTANNTNNLDVDWQPVPTVPVSTPETPSAIVLPIGAAGIFLLVGIGLRRRQRRLA